MRIPEKYLTKLLIGQNYIEREHLNEYLQQGKAEGKNLDEIIDSPEIQAYIKYIKEIWDSVIFSVVAMHNKKVTQEDIRWALLTQNAIYDLKQKIRKLDEILVVKEKITEKDQRKIYNALKELSLAQYEKLHKEALELYTKEVLQEKAEKKSVETEAVEHPKPIEAPPPSKLEPESEPEKPKKLEIIEIELEPEKEDFVSFAPPSKFSDLYDISSTEPIRKPEQQLQKNKATPLTAAATITGGIVLMIIIAVIWYGRVEIKDVKHIRNLVEKKEYEDLEDYCLQFLTEYPSSKYRKEVIGYYQKIKYNEADIALRQKRLKDAQQTIVESMKWGNNADIGRTSQVLLAQIESDLAKQKIHLEYKSKSEKILQSARKGDWRQALKQWKKMRIWRNKYDHILPEDNFLRKAGKKIHAARNRQFFEACRFYPYHELKKHTTFALPEVAEGVSLELFPLPGKQERRKLIDDSGQFFMVKGGYLYALEASSGKLSWIHRIGENALFPPVFIAGFREHHNINFCDKVLVVATQRNSLQLLDITNGELIWERILPSVICNQPALYKDKIFINCSDGFCYTISVATGELIGGYRCIAIGKYSPVFDRRGLMYIQEDNSLLGYDLQNEKLLWHLKTEFPAAPVVSVYPYLFFFRYQNGNTEIYRYLVNKKNLTLVQEQPEIIPGKMLAPAYYAGGILAIATEKKLVFFEVNSANSQQLLTRINALELKQKKPVQMRFDSFFRYFLLAGDHVDILEQVHMPEKIRRTILPGKDGATIIPLQKCGNLFFQAKFYDQANIWQGTAFTLREQTPEVIWQVQFSNKVEKNSLLTTDGRLLIGDQKGNIHEIFVNAKEKIGYRKIPGSINGNLSWIPGNARIMKFNDKEIRILDSTGKTLTWHPQPPLQGKIGRVIQQKGTIFVGAENGVFGFSAETGKKNYIEYSQMGGKPFHGPLLVYRNTLLVGSDDGILYQLAMGKKPQPYLQEIWKFPTEGALRSDALLNNDTIYFASQDRKLYAINLLQHRLLWKIDLPGEIVSKPLYHENFIYFGARDRHFYSVNATTGTISWKQRFSGEIVASPLLFHNKIYVASIAGEFRSYSLKGKLFWEIPLAGSILSAPKVLQGRIFVANSFGMLYCLKEK